MPLEDKDSQDHKVSKVQRVKAVQWVSQAVQVPLDHKELRVSQVAWEQVVLLEQQANQADKALQDQLGNQVLWGPEDKWDQQVHLVHSELQV